VGGDRVNRRRGVAVACGYVLALLLVAVGAGWELGVGWGLVVGGVLAGGSLLFLVDLDGRSGGG